MASPEGNHRVGFIVVDTKQALVQMQVVDSKSCLYHIDKTLTIYVNSETSLK
jgi:hypothetical protein